MIACCADSIILTISPDSGSYCGETALCNEEYRAQYPQFQFHTNVVAKSPFLSDTRPMRMKKYGTDLIV